MARHIGPQRLIVRRSNDVLIDLRGQPLKPIGSITTTTTASLDKELSGAAILFDANQSARAE